MKRGVIFILSFATPALVVLALAVLLPGCNGEARDSEQAREVLIAFFDTLSKGNYAEATALYGGSYETLVDWNPDVSPDDHSTLWHSGCSVNGLQCLKVLTATFNERTATGEYIFTVQFSNPDGSLFVREACCGETPTSPPVWQFEYRVVRGGDGQYRVLDLPVFTQ
jgi:hypothetical protein